MSSCIRALERTLVVVSALCLSILSLNAAEVTPERLLHTAAEPENWLMNLGSYDGGRYSGLSIINRDNIERLVVRYSIPLGGLLDGGGTYREALPVSPLVEDGFIYVVDGWGAVSKLDARRKGAVVWRNDAGQHNLDAWLQASRGIALYRNFVISAGADGRIHWIDTESGELMRSVQVGDPTEGYSIVAPPLVVGDRIIVGGGGSDRGARGRIDALDARTGEKLWWVNTVPSRKEPGGETWIGGGTFSQSGTYDPATGLSIWAAGHPIPKFESGERRGDDLYANSAIAVDVASGAVRWRFQYTPGGGHGFSEGGTHQLVPSDEGSAPAIVHFANNGFFYVLDGADGAFRSATPHVDGIAWTAGIDPASGKPIEYASDIETGSRRLDAVWGSRSDCPNIRSAAALASAYSPRTRLSYGAGADGCLDGELPPIKTPSAPGWLGAYYAGAAADLGMLSAIDPESGTVVAQRLLDFPLHSGVLATAGGLVFTTTAEGSLHALDDETLAPLWKTKFASLTAVPPITFEVDGEQFVAVIVGGNAFAGELSYRPPEMSLAQPIFVLAVLGLPS